MTRYRAKILLTLAFIVPMILMLIVLRSMEFYPFGEKSLLIMDMAGQVVQGYEHLPYIASGDANIFFSWSKSYGTNFTGFFAFYLSNPLALLMLLFKDIQLGVFWLTVLSISLCGLSSFFYFYNIKNCKTPAVLLFTTSYAMMSYNIVYSLSPMWINAVIMLPIIISGAHIILRGGKPWVFIISTALLLIFNYYTAYMACLFTVLYVICVYFLQPRQERALSIPRTLGVFAVSFIAALGMAAWLLVPTYLNLTAGKIGHVNYMPPGISNFELGAYIQAFLPRTYTSISTNGVPALYTGILTAVLCLFYFLTPHIKTRAKLLMGGLFVILLCSFYFVRTEVIWHIFQYPNWFPFRYAFVFQFLAVATACDALQSLQENRRSQPCVRPSLKTIIPLLLLLTVCWDLGTNAAALFNGLDRQFGYRPAALHRDFINETKPIIEEIHNQDDDFYRIEKTYIHSLNDAMSLGYKGIAHYSSMFSRDVLTVTKQLGMAQTYFWNGYIGSTPATDALFSVKYVLSKIPMPHDALFSHNDITVYQNPYVLPVAFFTDNLLTMPEHNSDCFAVQNEIYKQLGADEIFTPAANIEKIGTSYTFTSNGMPVYAYFPAYTHTGNSLYVNGEMLIERYLSTDDNNAVYIGTYPQGTQITISFDAQEGPPNLRGEHIYTLDTQALANAAENLRTGGLNEITFTATTLRGIVNANENGYLFISIPYDEGWTVRVNGEKIETTPALDAFMSIHIPPGPHTIEMSFIPQGLIIGLIISAISALGLVGAIFIVRGRQNAAPT